MASKTDADPTGQRDNRKRTTRVLQARLKKARRESITIFRNVPNTRIVANQVIYGYDLNPGQAEILNNQFRKIVGDALDTTADTMPLNWWFQKNIEIPYRQGTIEGLNEFNRLISIADSQGMVGAGGITAQRLAPEVFLSSPKYLSEIRTLYIDDYQVIKSLSDNTASQVIGEVNRGMKAGSYPSEIADNIAGRYDVAQSNAERIARTEVNRAYNDAKMRAIKTASETSGFKARVRHISALLPERTRKTHAARHYLVYTVEEQNAWWERDANRINCLCHVRPILIGDDGNYIER